MAVKKLKKNGAYKKLNPRFSKGLRSIKLASKSLIDPIFSKKSFKYSSIYKDWVLIVGKEVARYSTPKSISPHGTLTVYVDTAFSIEFQHKIPIVIDRISEVFGINNIKKIHILQTHFDFNMTQSYKQKNNKKIKNIGHNENIRLESVLINTKDTRLKLALKNLGIAITSNTKAKVFF